FPEYFQHLKHRKILPAESAQSDPKTLELVEAYLKPLGITSLLDAPIFVGGEVIGVFCCEHVGPPREWTTEERDFVASIADLLAAKYRAVQVQKLQRTLEVNESRLFTLEKSDALAKMALGVAHDFRNMLVSISNSAHVLKLAHNLPEDLREPAEIIKEAAEMGERLVSELIDYGRNAPAKPEAINLDNAIDKFLPFVRTAVGRDHEILVEHSPATGRVFIDRNQLDRVLLNLVVNAREASPPGSKIRIRTDQCVPDVESQANYVTLEISDSGKGMDEQTQQRLFEPFFSTKNRGSGLGMAVVQRIVDRAGGFIRVDSQLGQGTTIRVHLPRVSVSD
ncbi:MAG: GAF domain-containing protein, partial [Pirellulaceae bacterium]|nr:GAF domain-containing protein [Pirellulaceae bacterium]